MTANELIAQALAKLDGASREVALDLSSVSRIDPSAIGALEKLAGAADEKAVKVSLRGVASVATIDRKIAPVVKC